MLILSALPLLIALASPAPSSAAEVERATVGPDYASNPLWFSCPDCARGERFDLYMPIADTYFNCDPYRRFPTLKEICQPNCGQKFGPPGTRNITVYIPSQYEDGDEAAILVDVEGTDWYWQDLYQDMALADGKVFNPSSDPRAFDALMDNMFSAEDEDSLPPFVHIAVALAGPGSGDAWTGGADNCGDGAGTPREIELVTVSDAYANFIADELLPYVAAHPDIKEKYPNFKITDDPAGRVVQGQSNGGAAAVKMAHFRPDLFGSVIAFSPALIEHANNTVLTSDEEYPLSNAEFWVPPPDGQDLIANSDPPRKGRFYLNANENDAGTPNWCVAPGPGTEYGNFVEAANRTADALAAKGHAVQFVYGLNGCHTDPNVITQEWPNALKFVWADWKEKVESEAESKSAPSDGATMMGTAAAFASAIAVSLSV